MSEMWILAMALLAGISLGALFYGGLWWTVRRSLWRKNTGVWLIGSFLLRATIAAGGFYYVAQHDWRSMLGCLLGFLSARICVTRLTRAPPQRQHRFAGGTGP